MRQRKKERKNYMWGEKVDALISTVSITAVVVVLITGIDFSIGALWPAVRVLEPRGESLIVKGAFEALVATTSAQ